MRGDVCFENGDHEMHRDLLAEQPRKAKVEVWGWCCLAPDHLRLIVTPRTAGGSGRAVGETHRRCTNFIDARGAWAGELFQRRFSSVAMDETHRLAAARYVQRTHGRATGSAASGMVSTYCFAPLACCPSAR
jgi:putative transposase